MKRPWQVWLVFAVCVGGAALALGWLTRQAIEADEQRRAAQADADFEQRVSLAMWRMDTELAPIIAGEVIRAPWMYRSAFLTADGTAPLELQPPRNASPNQAAQVEIPPGIRPAAQPSPLLLEPPAYVICNFEATLDASWNSPQVPDPRLKDFALSCGASPESIAGCEASLAELSSTIDLPKLLSQLPETTLPTAAALGFNNFAVVNALTVEQVNELQRSLNLYAGNGGTNWAQNPGQEAPNSAQVEEEPQSQNLKVVGKGGKIDDFAERNRRYQSVTQQGILEQQQQQRQYPTPKQERPVTIGVSRPVWIGERLLLARRVEDDGKTYVQGSWLDWPKLKTRLLAETVDLSSAADLVPVRGDGEVDPGRMLAGLPVRLVANAVAAPNAGMNSSLAYALWMGWGALALAAGAAAALLAGVMALSERRAAFVSSVTHELRTPLTTFRMYAEMLARGMVPDAARRQEYLHTLERESERLTNLVENVLAYARLERGRRPQVADSVTPRSLVERVAPRLRQRAQQADMKCDFNIDPTAADIRFTTDQGVAEQILFNLVDNAAKYARAAEDRRIHVNVRRSGDNVAFTIYDHGPGFQRKPGRFRPFAKSAQESAETAPGVGLGLALCTRLARQLNGSLEIGDANGGGASVSLILPANR